MHAHIEGTTFAIRWYASDIVDGETGYDRGEPYIASCFANLSGPDKVFVMLLQPEFGLAHMRAVAEAARPWGIKRIEFLRGDGSSHVIELR